MRSSEDGPHDAGGCDLSVDTCLGRGSVSVWSGGVERGWAGGNTQRTLSADLPELIVRVLTETGFGTRDLRRIVYTNGPGSYTGLRVGMASVLGLVRSLGCAAGTVSVFEALSVGASGEPCLALTGAGGGRLAGQLFEADGTRVYEMRLYESAHEVREHLSENCRPVLAPDLFGKLSAEDLSVLSEASREPVRASDNVAGLAYRFYKDMNFEREPEPPFYTGTF